MKNAELFSDVMSLLWGFDEALVSPFRTAQAIASWAKTHKVNPENAFDVLNIVWPCGFEMTARFGDPEKFPEPGVFWFDVKFEEDGSQCMVRSNQGIGDSVEVT